MNLSTIFLLSTSLIVLAGRFLTQPTPQEEIYKTAMATMRRSKKYVDSPLQLANLFKNWYLPIEQRSFFLEKARKDNDWYKKCINVNSKLRQSIYERISHNSNMIILISGQPGSGKSIIGLALMQLIKEIRYQAMKDKKEKKKMKLRGLIRQRGKYKKDKALWKEFQRKYIELQNDIKECERKTQCKLHLAFNGSQLTDKIKNKMGDGDIVQCDEWENSNSENELNPKYGRGRCKDGTLQTIKHTCHNAIYRKMCDSLYSYELR